MVEFPFRPASFLPSRDVEMLERVREVPREEMEYTNENGYSVKVVLNPALFYVQDLFHRIYLSDIEDRPFVAICPNPHKASYEAVADMINKYNVNCRNFHAFAMDEWADEDGNVAPLTYGAGLGHNFVYNFYYRIREELRPPLEQWHTFNNDNKAPGVYSAMIEEAGGGGADVVYSATGWPGHTAFIDPGTEEFAADSLEEFLTLGSRLVTETPLTIAENSLFPVMGDSGDVWAVPPRAATIGPRDIVTARERFSMHGIAHATGSTWQRMISRIELYGPISMECPASIMRLGPGTCYVSEVIARPFGSWKCGVENKDL